MSCFRRVRVVLLLGLGSALLPASAWSYREAVRDQVVPHGDAGYEYFSGGGARPAAEPSADRVDVAAPTFYELVRSVWLLVSKMGILP